MKTPFEKWVARRKAHAKRHGIRESTEVGKIASRASAAMYDLSNLAGRGNQEAAEAIVNHLMSWIDDLKKLETEHAALFIPSAQCSITWPGYISIDRDVTRSEAGRLRALSVGTTTGFNYGGRKQWSRATPETKVALQLSAVLMRGRKRAWEGAAGLPEFTRATYRQYYKAAIPLLHQVYGVRFENHPIFARYRHHVSAKNPDSLRPDTKRRQMILTKLEQSFRTLAPINSQAI
jgi:hypothetical protein